MIGDNESFITEKEQARKTAVANEIDRLKRTLESTKRKNIVLKVVSLSLLVVSAVAFYSFKGDSNVKEITKSDPVELIAETPAPVKKVAPTKVETVEKVEATPLPKKEKVEKKAVIPAKKQEPKKAVIKTSSTINNSTTYSIQIGVFSQKKTSLAGLESDKIIINTKGKLQFHFYGQFNTPGEAENALKAVKDAGYSSSFVIKMVNGEKVA